MILGNGDLCYWLANAGSVQSDSIERYYYSISIGDVITWGVLLLTAVLAYYATMRQVNIQHKKNIDLAKENFKKELQIKAVEEIIEIICQISVALYSLEVYSRMISLDLGQLSNAVKEEIFKKYVDSLEENNKELEAAWEEFTKRVGEFKAIIQSRYIIIYEFQNMLNFLGAEFERFKNFYYVHMLNKIITRYNFPTVVGHSLVKTQTQKCDEFQNKCEELLWYLDDLSVELQNCFLFEICKNKLPRRDGGKKGPERVLTIDMTITEEDLQIWH